MSSTELVPIAIPPALEKAGVTVSDQNGVRAVMIPRELEATYNVVQPVSEISATDPDWSPRLVVVNLNLSDERHAYKEQGKLALTKNAILLMASAAGVDVDVSMIPRSELRDSEIGYKATATIRRSDGTLARFPGHKVGDYDDLKAEIAGTNKKWQVEKAHYPAKIETKAILRAVAGALQLKRGGWTRQELERPFLIVGWSLTPSDPEVRRLRVLQAGDALAGRGLPAPSVETPTHDEPAPVAQIAPAHDVVDEVPATAAPVSQEPDPNEPAAGEIPADVLAAGEVIFGEGFRAKGKKISETRPEYLRHIAFEHQYGADQEIVVMACRTWVAWLNSQDVQP